MCTRGSALAALCNAGELIALCVYVSSSSHLVLCSRIGLGHPEVVHSVVQAGGTSVCLSMIESGCGLQVEEKVSEDKEGSLSLPPVSCDSPVLVARAAFLLSRVSTHPDGVKELQKVTE